MKSSCAICKRHMGLLQTKNTLADRNVICTDCSEKVAKALGFSDKNIVSQTLKFSMLSLENAERAVNTMIKDKPSLRERNSKGVQNNKNREYREKVAAVPTFVEDRAISSNGLSADFTSKKVRLTIGTFKKSTRLLDFSEIVSYSPHVEGHEVKKHHGLTRAATGGLLFGGAGAIVGAVTGGKQFDQVTRVSITVRLSDGEAIEYNLLPTGKTKSTSFEAKTANGRLEDMSALLDRIIEANHTPTPVAPQIITEKAPVSPADEIRKYKSLLDDSIITQEEFDAKKRSLLSL
ncbi:SHOCT domain-containing protein [Levilactobacillus brevis]|uniref:SHOCT domain-containing protein n=1 Tax=Levilactobacillus brevis TaxID=1580 RepID=UPI0035A26A22